MNEFRNLIQSDGMTMFIFSSWRANTKSHRIVRKLEALMSLEFSYVRSAYIVHTFELCVELLWYHKCDITYPTYLQLIQSHITKIMLLNTRRLVGYSRFSFYSCVHIIWFFTLPSLALAYRSHDVKCGCTLCFSTLQIGHQISLDKSCVIIVSTWPEN